MKVAFVLLEQGKLTQYSDQPYREISVKTPNETVVYEVWKEIDEQDKYVPKIQTKRTTVNMGWFEKHKGFSDIATNSDFVTGMQEERCDDVDGVNDQISAVHISLESHMAATETVLKQLPMPLTQAKQLLPLMEAVFGYSSFQLKQDQAIDSCLKKRTHLL